MDADDQSPALGRNKAVFREDGVDPIWSPTEWGWYHWWIGSGQMVREHAMRAGASWEEADKIAGKVDRLQEAYFVALQWEGVD